MIFAEEVTEPDGLFTVTEYSPASASEQESILSVHCPFSHPAVSPFAFVSTAMLSFCQAASTGSDSEFIDAINSSAVPASTLTGLKDEEKTGGSIEARYVEKGTLKAYYTQPKI